MSDYLEEIPLIRWFAKAHRKNRLNKFPGAGATDYWLLFSTLHTHLNSNIHPSTDAAAAATEPNLYLTKHGPEHIKVVIQKAQKLIASKKWAETELGAYECSLTPYEVFILLIAIHFHDIANRSGRKGHEDRIRDEVSSIPIVQQIERFARDEIIKIAACHGGKPKNKIEIKLSREAVSGNIKYRPQLVAAVLKLADELADDSTRADLHGLKDPDTFPKSALLYHKYAASLDTVYLEAATGSIQMQFHFTKNDACVLFWREDTKSDTYLLDYIFERTLKTYRELTYCFRFMRQLPVNYHDIKVSIQVFRDEHDSEEGDDLSPLEKIEYVIGNSGYPDDNHGNIHSLAKDLDPALNGASLAARLNTLTVSAP